MASESRLFTLSPVVQKLVKDFRVAKQKSGTSYIAFSINKSTHQISPDEDEAIVVEDVDDLVDELPDNTPRYILVSYDLTHDDGRRSMPLFLIYWIPRTASIEMSTLYASAKVWFSEKCDVAKVLEIRDADDLTKDYIEDRLKNAK